MSESMLMIGFREHLKDIKPLNIFLFTGSFILLHFKTVSCLAPAFGE